MPGEDDNGTRSTVGGAATCQGHSGVLVLLKTQGESLKRIDAALSAFTQRMGDGDRVFAVLEKELQTQKTTLKNIYDSLEKLVADGAGCGKEMLDLVSRIKDVEARVARIEKTAEESKTFRKSVLSGTLVRLLSAGVACLFLYLLYCVQQDLAQQRDILKATVINAAPHPNGKVGAP